jgi:hypothetical protein
MPGPVQEAPKQQVEVAPDARLVVQDAIMRALPNATNEQTMRLANAYMKDNHKETMAILREIAPGENPHKILRSIDEIAKNAGFEPSQSLAESYRKHDEAGKKRHHKRLVNAFEFRQHSAKAVEAAGVKDERGTPLVSNDLIASSMREWGKGKDPIVWEDMKRAALEANVSMKAILSADQGWYSDFEKSGRQLTPAELNLRIQWETQMATEVSNQMRTQLGNLLKYLGDSKMNDAKAKQEVEIALNELARLEGRKELSKEEKERLMNLDQNPAAVNKELDPQQPGSLAYHTEMLTTLYYHRLGKVVPSKV